MPTKSSQITPSYNSGIQYKDYTCDELKIELDALSRRETMLTVAQEQRYKNSETQAFWWGYGQGDGIEAAELAQVRGSIEAVRKVMSEKGCNQ